MKKIYLILIAIFNLTTMNAQNSRPSIQETKTWILEKLNKYASGSTTYGDGVVMKYNTYTTNYNYSFIDDFNLKVTYLSENKKSEYYIIPICNVKFLKRERWRTGSDANYQFYSSYSVISHEGEFKFKTKECWVYLNFDEEPNLFTRFVKAFTNLQSYCKNETSNETF